MSASLGTDAFAVLGPQEVLREIVAAARDVPIAEFEGQSSGQLCDELVPRVLRLCRRSLRVLNSLVESEFDESADNEWLRGESGRAFLRRVDRLMKEVDSSDHLGGLAFMARGELRSKMHQLERLDSGNDAWEIIDVAGSVLRKIVKTATALDQLIGRSTGDIHLDFETELDSSLEVRRIYGKLRRDLNRTIDSSHDDSLRLRMQNASTAIARLIGRDAYPKLRIADRVEIRSLQARLLEWKSGEGCLASGRRMLEDLVGFVGLLSQISRRQELVEHDQMVISEALTVLGVGKEALPEELQALLEKSLQALYGLDEELDSWIAEETSPLAELEEILHRLAGSARFGSAPGGHAEW